MDHAQIAFAVIAAIVALFVWGHGCPWRWFFWPFT
jgi:hypothetical protein